jgi:hypothetical protein
LDDRERLLYQGYRLINTVGASLLATLGVLLMFAMSYAAHANDWPALPLEVSAVDGGVFLLAAAVPPGARGVLSWVLARLGRRGRVRGYAEAIQLVGWVATAVWASCQIPLVMGFALAFLKHRALYLLPFAVVAVGGAYLAVPRFALWGAWLKRLEDGGAGRRRARSVR